MEQGWQVTSRKLCIFL